jgi:hypothetical protein
MNNFKQTAKQNKELEKLVDESLDHVESNTKVLDDEKLYLESEVGLLLKLKEKETIDKVLNLLKEHKYNQLDSINRVEGHKVGEWLEGKLK